MNNNNGFGIVEILIVIVILSLGGIFAFKSYTGKTIETAKTGIEQSKQAKELEGRLFISALVNAEKMYYALNGQYVYTSWTASNAQLGINSFANVYFKEFAVEKSADGEFKVKVRGSGDLEGVELSS
ncbi:MAG: prepilin-type N-terminal cleavage/methylation domain-containing protein [Endomicrobium sp.]|jgi:Tfp pilus assembly protein PilE|nr:prepilin-type N-terminal cleavage/methylation domain-containing protein [Endomicrobium sp.]